MITLRKLQLKDVPLMLEWMHDEEAKHIFQNNFYYKFHSFGHHPFFYYLIEYRKTLESML